MKLFTSYLVVVAAALAAFAPIAQAGNPSPAMRALEIRGQAMNTLCDNPTLSREGYVALCGTKGASQQPTRAVLRAYEIRGKGMDALCDNPTLARESYVAVCGTKGAANQPTRAELQALQIRGEAMDAVTAVPVATASRSFDWNDFGIGAASMLGFVLLVGGLTAGVHYGRKSSPRPRPAS